MSNDTFGNGSPWADPQQPASDAEQPASMTPTNPELAAPNQIPATESLTATFAQPAADSPWAPPAPTPPDTSTQLSYADQQTYGAPQSPYATPQAPYATPQVPYSPQAPYPGAGQSYPGQPSPYPTANQQYSTAQPYPAATPYVPAYPPATVKTPKSPVLGIIGFAGGTLMGIILCILVFNSGVWTSEMLMEYGYYYGDIDTSMLPTAELEKLGADIALIGILSLIALAAWIISIVATATNKGRGWGIGGIIVGVVAPTIAVFLWFTGLTIGFQF